MYTFNNIYDAFKDIATAHKQINTYGMGDLWEMTSSGTVTYPLMWAKPEDSRIEQSVFVSSWTLLFMDLVDDGEANENDVLSDMELVALDVIALLKNNDYEFDFKGTGITLQRFTERFEDKVAGVGIRVDLRVPYTADRCQVPQSGLDVSGTAPCDPVTIYDSNGAIVTTVASGGTYTLELSLIHI